MKLSLPGNILREIGVPSDPTRDESGASNSRWKSQDRNRKDRRKAERSLKRQRGPAPRPSATRSIATKEKSAAPRSARPQQSISATKSPAPTERESSPDNIRKRKRTKPDVEEPADDHKPRKRTAAVRDRLAEDDAEIIALEKKLGIRGRKKLPQSFHADGLGDLLGESDPEDAPKENLRMKADLQDYVESKRRKARKQHDQSPSEDSNDDIFDQSDSDIPEEHGDEDRSLFDEEESDLGSAEEDEEDFEGDSDTGQSLDSEQASSPADMPKRVRENPYIAPMPSSSNGPKYIPPSLRKALGNDADLDARIKRRMQGHVNRVTEANLISVVGEIEKLYREFPRGIVTDILSELLMAQVCDQTLKPDTLLVLSAGFMAALYKVIGVDFAARLVQTIVERFQQEYDRARSAFKDGHVPTKETSNLITLLSEMYMFRVVGSNVLFDYIKLLLQDLSELNAELLLRIVRLAGPQLRKDDPLALKDIVTLIRPAVAEVGEANLTVRTKFMIETINDLKNNKIKAGSQDLVVLTEHVTRMRKLLGSMDTTKIKATEPLRVGLADIQNIDKTGKWWLVGASWGGRQEDKAQDAASASDNNDDDDGSDGRIPADELDIPDYAELAREQGMNTDVRRAVFIALVAAADVQDAYLRILKLGLNKHNRREIANVLVQCSSAQQHYNPYYTLVAGKFCGDSRIRYAFQDVMWTLFRRLGEPLFGEEAEDEDDEAAENRRLINVAKMFGNLIVDSNASIAVLKPLNLAYIKDTTSLLVEVLLITVLQGCSRKKDMATEDALAKIFVPSLPTELARGLRYILRKKVRGSDLVEGRKGAKEVRKACEAAERLLERHQGSM
jgi:nucleolar MIF4G domain-containing protein 1